MGKESRYKKFFQFTSAVTDLFPRTGARFFDILFQNTLGNGMLLKVITRWANKKIESVKKFERFLVVADLNIGDAVIESSAVNALKRLFPSAEIDFVVKRSTRALIEGNPDVSNLYPIYDGAPFPTEKDLSTLVRVAKSKNYDLIINFSPMIEDKIFNSQNIGHRRNQANVVNFFMMAAEMIRAESHGERISNVSYQAYHFIRELFCGVSPRGFNERFSGANIYLSNETVKSASDFLASRGISNEKPVIMFNPDASSRFTRIPFETQVDILRKLGDIMDGNCDILLGAGHAEQFIEYEVLYALPEWMSKKIVIAPASLGIEVYTALIDFADVFITGDTGPLHLAAARKFSRESGKSLRNTTAIFSVFGGTPPRIYGYDSNASGFFPANQDAPSKVFVSKSPCRNITCINKMAKTCKKVRCFEPLDSDEIVSQVESRLVTTYQVRANQEYLVSSK